MAMISKAAVGIAVGVAGLFVGYCYYFDQKRRNDPDFKKKLREREFMFFFFKFLRTLLFSQILDIHSAPNSTKVNISVKFLFSLFI